jgi:hypothetical protein
VPEEDGEDERCEAVRAARAGVGPRVEQDAHDRLVPARGGAHERSLAARPGALFGVRTRGYQARDLCRVALLGRAEERRRVPRHHHGL